MRIIRSYIGATVKTSREFCDSCSATNFNFNILFPFSATRLLKLSSWYITNDKRGKRTPFHIYRHRACRQLLLRRLGDPEVLYICGIISFLLFHKLSLYLLPSLIFCPLLFTRMWSIGRLEWGNRASHVQYRCYRINKIYQSNEKVYTSMPRSLDPLGPFAVFPLRWPWPSPTNDDGVQCGNKKNFGRHSFVTQLPSDVCYTTWRK